MALLQNTTVVGNVELQGAANMSVTTLTASTHVSSSLYYGDGSNLTSLTASQLSNFGTDVRNLVSGTGFVSYDNSTGVISLSSGTITVGSTAITLGNSSTVIAGLTQLTSSNISASSGITAGTFTGDGSGLTGLAAGSDNQIQFNNSGELGGSSSLTFDGSTLDLNGDLTVAGKITAREFHTELVSSSIVYESGSTKFGDTADDTHQFSGSILLSGSMTSTATITANAFSGDGSSLTSIATGNITNFNSTVRGLISAPSADGVSYDNSSGQITLSSIPNSSLTNSTIQFGSTPASLGDTVTVIGVTTLSASSVVSGAAVQAGTFTGNGAAITNITASNISNFTTDVRAQLSAGSGISFSGGSIALTSNSISVGGSSVSLGNNLTTIGNLSALTASLVAVTTELSAASFVGDGSSLTGVTAEPAGNDTEIQFNNGGSSAGDSNLTWNGTVLAVGGVISGSGNVSGSAFYGDGANVTGIVTSNITNFQADVRSQLSAGTGISFSSGEFSLPQAVGTTSDVTFNSISGNGASLTNLTASNMTNFSTDVRGLFSAGTGISISSGEISTSDSAIVHDNLSGFVANEHIDHSGVSLTAGNGLTGGGDITASRTFAVGAGTGITVNANDVAIDTSVVPQLSAGNTFTGDNTFSGNTTIGNASGDVHQVSGSLEISGSVLHGGSGAQVLSDAVSKSVTGDVALYTVPSNFSSFTMDYKVVKSGGSHMKAGVVHGINDGSDVSIMQQHTEIGDASSYSWDVNMVGGSMVISGSAGGDTYTVTFHVRSL